jgi:hypothetical protein
MDRSSCTVITSLLSVVQKWIEAGRCRCATYNNRNGVGIQYPEQDTVPTTISIYTVSGTTVCQEYFTSTSLTKRFTPENASHLKNDHENWVAFLSR